MVASHAVLVRDRPTARHDRLAHGALQRRPAFERRGPVGTEAEDERRVGARPGRIDVREVRVGVALLTELRERVASGRLERLHGRRRREPGHGGLHRVDGPAELPQRVAEVHGGESVFSPLAAQPLAGGDAAVRLEHGRGLAPRRIDLSARAREPEHHHRPAGPCAAPREVTLEPLDLPGVTRQAQHGHGFHGVRQAQHRERRAQLDQRARCGHARLPVRQEHGDETLDLGHAAHAHDGFGDHADPAFRAEHELAQVRARRTRRERRNAERASRSLDRPAGEQLFDASVAQRLLARGAARDPAAERRVFEALREVSEHETARTQRRLDVGTDHSRLESGELRDLVEFEQRVHAPHVERQARPLAGRRHEVTGDARGAAARNEHDVAFGRPGEQLANLGVRRGPRDAVGDAAQVAKAQANPVAEALADAEPYAVLGARRDERVKIRPAGEPRGVLPVEADADFLERRAAARGAGSYRLGQEGLRFLGHRGRDRVVAPAVPASHRQLPVSCSGLRESRSSVRQAATCRDRSASFQPSSGAIASAAGSSESRPARSSNHARALRRTQ